MICAVCVHDFSVCVEVCVVCPSLAFACLEVGGWVLLVFMYVFLILYVEKCVLSRLVSCYRSVELCVRLPCRRAYCVVDFVNGKVCLSYLVLSCLLL